MLGFMLSPTRPGYYSAVASTTDVSIAADTVERQLTRRIEGLELACAGLWELLKQRHGYTDADIVACIREVDLRDGVEDGRVRVTDAACPQCGRQLLSRKSPNCSWCGAELPKAPF
jgi:hypothetical protein